LENFHCRVQKYDMTSVNLCSFSYVFIILNGKKKHTLFCRIGSNRNEYQESSCG
jgi:hypothetical protein